MRKVETSNQANSKQQMHYAGEYQHVPAKNVIHKVNYLQQSAVQVGSSQGKRVGGAAGLGASGTNYQ